MSASLFTDTVPPNVAPTPTASSMIQLLRRHYLHDESRPAGVFAPEIQAPGPQQRRADLIWLGCTAAAGNDLVGHEVKVTRSDVLAELADLTKSDPWQRYCDRWWLVIPDLSLIKGLEIPKSWGVMLPPSGRRTRSMTIHHPAPKLRPLEQGPALKTLAAWQCWKLRDAQNHAADRDKRMMRAEQELHQLQLTARDHRPSPEREVVARIVRELGGVWVDDQIGTWRQQVAVEDVIAALQDLGTVYGRRDAAQRTLNHAQEQLETAGLSIGRALQEIRDAVTR